MTAHAVEAAVDAALGEVVRQTGSLGRIAIEARGDGILAAEPLLEEIRRRSRKEMP